MTIVCGDSHTSTHGAFGALAFGIGTSEVEHVLATQTLQQRKPKSMRILYSGELGYGVSAKDLILGTIGRIGVDGRRGPRDRVRGPADRGAVDGGPDDRLQHDDRGRRPRGDDRPRRHDLRVGRGPRRPRPTPLPLDEWRELRTDDGAASTPRWPSTPPSCRPRSPGAPRPGMVTDVTAAVPEPAERGRRARARVHGAGARHADAGDPAGPRVHRLVHQLAHRRPARGRRGGAGRRGRVDA